MTPQELISLLKQQHQGLVADFTLAIDSANETRIVDIKQVVSNLRTARADLAVHMKTENTLFYTDYLEKKLKMGQDLEKTRRFIREMDDIGIAANNFFDTYHSEKVILENQSEFRKELSAIFSRLKIRMEVEEEGIFGVYLLM